MTAIMPSALYCVCSV